MALIIQQTISYVILAKSLLKKSKHYNFIDINVRSICRDNCPLFIKTVVVN